MSELIAALSNIGQDLNKYFKSNEFLMEKQNNNINIDAFSKRELFLQQIAAMTNLIEELKGAIAQCSSKTRKIHIKELEMMNALINGNGYIIKKPRFNAIQNDTQSVARNPAQTTDNLHQNKDRMICNANYNLIQNQPQNSQHIPYNPNMIFAPLSLQNTTPHITQPGNNWASVVRKKSAKNPPPTIEPIHNSPAKVDITPNLHLSAIYVQSFKDVKQDGCLYYIEPCDHFAIKINGTLISGNIGIIYTNESNPKKIKDCKFKQSCIKQKECDYYHDPLVFDNSKDHRNYIASSLVYINHNDIQRSRGCRFGSRDHLDFDIQDISEEEKNKFKDASMSSLLCTLLLLKK